MPSPAPDRPGGPGVVHLIPHSTFLPFVVRTFEEAAPSRNRFLVYGPGDLARYALPTDVRAEVIGMDAGDVSSTVSALAESDVAVIHSMSTFSALVLAALPPSTLRVWSGWGAEYYGSRFDPTAHLFSARTGRQERRHTGFKQMALNAYNARYVDGLYRSAAASTDVFSAPAPTDLAVFRRRFRRFRGRYRQLNYASVEDTYSTAPDRVIGSSVLVGNSATPENNHLDVLPALARLDLGDRKVIVPLSYGDPAYADDVVAAGSELLGSRFVPVRDFLPLAEYNALVAECGIVVMGHRRQQALGNIARALWQGANVFMDHRSPLYTYLRDAGLGVQTLDRLTSGGPPSGPVADVQLDAVRAIARTLWSRRTVVENITALLDLAPAPGDTRRAGAPVRPPSA